MSESTILVWGGGAMGGTLAAYMLRAGLDVVVVDNNAAHVQAINQSGLQISGPIDNFAVPMRALLPEELQGQYKNVFLCTKAVHTQAACNMLWPHLASDGVVLSVQNGLNEIVISEIVGHKRCMGCFVNFGADILSPGHIHYGGRGAVVLGELNGERSARVVQLHQWLQIFEPNAVLTDNIFGYLWSKLVYGTLLFATATTNGSIVEVLEHPKYRAALIALAREVVTVGDALQVRMESFNGFDPLAFGKETDDNAANKSMDDLVAFNRRSAKSHSGVWRDLVVHKRKTEVDFQLGMVVQEARKLKMATPLIQTVVDAIHAIEDGVPLDWAHLDKLCAVAQEKRM
jgi:2-dehydropantoate 2-reductase